MNSRSILPSVAPTERPRLLRAVVTFMCVSSAGVVARTAGTATFLSHYEAASLTYLYVASAAIVMAASLTFGWLLGRMALPKLLAGTAAGLTVITVLLWAALHGPWRWIAIASYLFSDLVSRVPTLLFWSTAGAAFNPREAKRLFVYMGVGGTASCVVAGALIKPLSAVFGTESLFLLVATQLAAFGVASRWWISQGSLAGTVNAPASTKASAMKNQAAIFRLPQVRHIGVAVTLGASALLITDFLFKSSARAHFAGPALAGFFGTFYSATAFTSLGVQLLVVHQVLGRGGVFAAAAALPAALLLLSIGAATTGGFGWIVAAKFADPVLDFTLNSAALQLLYLGIRKQSRSQARAVIEGLARPAANAATGLLLVSAVHFASPRVLAGCVALLSLAWIAASWRAYRSYVSGLVDAIGARRFDVAEETMAFGDPQVYVHLHAALRKAKDHEVLYLLGAVSQLNDADWSADFRLLLRRDTPEVQVAALEYLEAHGSVSDVALVRPFLDHPDPTVRTAAIHSSGRLGGFGVAEALTARLNDHDPSARAAATAELINAGDLDALLAACVTLKDMLADADPRARAASAAVLARITHTGLSRVLGDLLHDSDLAVRRAALQACASRPDHRLVPHVIDMLGDPDLGLVAADALATFGGAVVPYLRSFPENARGAPLPALLLVPRVLAASNDPEGLQLLAAALDAPNARLRLQVISAYCDVVAALPEPERPREQIIAATLRQVADSEQRAATMRSLAPMENAKLLRQVLDEERTDLLAGAFQLSGVLHPDVDMKSVFWILRSGVADQQAEALEVLDNLLDARVKTAMMSVFEAVRESVQASGDSEARLTSLLGESHSEWIVASAAFASGRHGVSSSLSAVRDLMDSDSVYVREAALDALSRLAHPVEVKEAASRVVEDESVTLRTLAQRLAGIDVEMIRS